MKHQCLLGIGLLLCAGGPLTGCGPSREPLQDLLTSGDLEDINPDPAIVEVNLAAAPVDWDPGTGSLIHGVGFNGRVPGPTLRAKVGDEIIVHFSNHMTEETTIHWHGLRIPNGMDGVHVTQHPVQPSGTFEYRFIVPDSGYFWFHPHMEVDVQMERGLYAPLVVEDPADPVVARDHTLVLDDVLLGSDGQIQPPQEGMDYVMGRLGNLLLVNGKTQQRMKMDAGTWQLWRIVNAANARHFDLQIEDHELLIVGSDGGYLPEPQSVDHLVIAPGERYLVLVHVTGVPGRSFAVKSMPFELHAEDSMMGDMMGESDPLGDGPQVLWTLDYSDLESVTLPRPTLPAASLPTWTLGGEVAHTWELRETMVSVSIDGEQYPNVPLVSLPLNAEVPYTFEIDNRTEMYHPFHIHGHLFQIVALDDEPVQGLGWKDTFNVPPNTKMTVVGLLDNPGLWLYHCHILEHEELGMMGELEVVAPTP